MLHAYASTISPGVLLLLTVCTMPIAAHGDQQDCGVCANFTISDPLTGVFTSPRYPFKYPPSTECIKIIHSPSPTLEVQLEFREIFDIEEEYGGLDGCNDFLEVRDGPYGFSPLVKKYCGGRFPYPIVSTTGSLWLRFYSDKLIERKGFKAVVSYPPTKDPDSVKIPCKFTKTEPDGLISTQDVFNFRQAFINSTNTSDYECVWEIQARFSHFRVRLSFDQFSLAFPNECSINSLSVYQGTTSSSSFVRDFCGLTAANLDIHASLVYIRLYLTVPAISDSVMSLIYTTYVPETNCTEPEMFRCNDNTCISRDLQCNHRRNCPLEEDEKECFIQPAGIQFSTGPYLAILIIIGALILVIAVCALIINVCPPRSRRRKREPLMTRSRGAQATLIGTPNAIELRAGPTGGSGSERVHSMLTDYRQRMQQPSPLTTLHGNSTSELTTTVEIRK